MSMRSLGIPMALVLGLLITTPVMSDPVGEASPREVVDHVIWKNIPIRVILPVGEERRLDFPVTVKIEWPRGVEEKTERLQIRENGSVYWTARESFEKRRVNVVTFTGETYLLDVEAIEGASARTLVILDDRFPPSGKKKTGRARTTAAYDGVDLVRYASQMLYAPRRVVDSLPGVVQIPVSTADVPLYKGGELRTAPIAQWKAPGSLYVTAVRVTSDSMDPVILDPRFLRGEWISATPQHGQVAESGAPDDTTAWYLVSERPFAETAPEGAAHE